MRSWIAIEPVEASGPGDPAIPFAPIVTERGAGDRVLLAARRTAASERRRAGICSCSRTGAARQLAPVVDRAVRARRALGGLWAPGPTDRALAQSRDVAARALRDRGRLLARSYHRWLGIEIQDLERRSAPPATASSPSLARVADAPSRRRRVGLTAGQSRRGGSREISNAARASMIAPTAEIQNP